jgi:predicted anti-sigma-YlaC factor YlaD
MSRQPDEHSQLESLLRMLPAPEPPAHLASAARRRYHEAIAARARREALMGLLAALIGLVVIATLTVTVTEPASLVVWLADTVADLARWTAGIGVILALVPPVVWGAVVLGSAATVLSLFVARARASLAK